MAHSVDTKRARLPHLSESYIILLNSRIYFIHIIVSRASNNYTIKQFVMVFLFFNICVHWNGESSQMVYMLYMRLVTAVGRKEKCVYVCIPTREMNAHNVLTQQKNLSKTKREKSSSNSNTNSSSIAKSLVIYSYIYAHALNERMKAIERRLRACIYYSTWRIHAHPFCDRKYPSTHTHTYTHSTTVAALSRFSKSIEI